MKHQLALCLLILCNAAISFSQTEIIVTQCKPNGWKKDTIGQAKINCDTMVKASPVKVGVKMTGSVPGDFARYRYSDFVGRKISDLIALEYETLTDTTAFVDNPDSIEAVLIIFLVDFDATNATHNLLFSPRYQNGDYTTNAPFSSQGPIVKDVVQKWNALEGGWWVNSGNVPDPDKGGTLTTLKAYVEKYPDAKFINQGNNGGFRLTAGSQVGNNFKRWNDYVVFADNLHVAFKDGTDPLQALDVLFNFEMDFNGAGKDTTLCRGKQMTIGFPPKPGVTYAWTPTMQPPYDQSISNPQVRPLQTTTYTLVETVTGTDCLNTSSVTITVQGGVGCLCPKKGMRKVDYVLCVSYEWVCKFPNWLIIIPFAAIIIFGIRRLRKR